MAAVAVLDIHIDRNHVGSIKPSINLNIPNTILLEHKEYQGEQLLDKDIGHKSTKIKNLTLHGSLDHFCHVTRTI